MSPRVTVTTIMKNKKKTLKAFESCFLPEQKRLRTAAHTDIEEALLLWFKQTRSLNVSISGDTLERDIVNDMNHVPVQTKITNFTKKSVNL